MVAKRQSLSQFFEALDHHVRSTQLPGTGWPSTGARLSLGESRITSPRITIWSPSAAFHFQALRAAHWLGPQLKKCVRSRSSQGSLVARHRAPLHGSTHPPTQSKRLCHASGLYQHSTSSRKRYVERSHGSIGAHLIIRRWGGSTDSIQGSGVIWKGRRSNSSLKRIDLKGMLPGNRE